jgi:hypothetical protein
MTNTYVNYYRVILILILMIIEKKYWLWSILALATFIPILPFYIGTVEYHYDSFCFFLVFIGMVSFDLINNVRPLIRNYFTEIKFRIPVWINWHILIRVICLAVVIFFVLFDSYTVVAYVMEKRKIGVIWAQTRKRNYYFQRPMLNHIANCLINSAKDNKLEIMGVKRTRDFSDASDLLLSLIKHKTRGLEIIFHSEKPVGNGESFTSSILKVNGINFNLVIDKEINQRFVDQFGINFVGDSGFERKSNENASYSAKTVHSGKYSMVVSKEDSKYSDCTNIYFAANERIRLTPGEYIFGGYYKTNNLHDGDAVFEIIDSRGHKKGCWRSKSIKDTSGWSMLAGLFKLEREINAVLRPIRISDFKSGEVFADDLFLIKIPE